MFDKPRPLPHWISVNTARERLARERLFGAPSSSPTPPRSSAASAPPGAPTSAGRVAISHARAVHKSSLAGLPGPVQGTVSSHYVVGYGLPLVALLVGFLIARHGLTRHFPDLQGIAHKIALAFGTVLLGYVLYSLGGVILVSGARGPIVLWFAGWFAGGVGVYLAQAYFTRSGRARRGLKEIGLINWLFGFVAGGLWRYVLTSFAGVMTGSVAIMVAGQFHASAAAGVPLLIGIASAAFFPPPSFFFFSSIASLLTAGAGGRASP